MKEIFRDQKSIIWFTLPIVMLVSVCSGIGASHPALYSKESTNWLSQCVGQDFSNLFCVVPVLLISTFFVLKGSRIAKIVWIGTMLANIYSYMIYCFSVHFNCLFHFYCMILGLSIYAVIIFAIENCSDDFKGWFSESAQTKPLGIFLLIIAAIFYFLWLSQSLPAAWTNSVPANIVSDALLTNPVHVLDYSFYLPLIVISAIMLLKRRNIGYILAPMMLIFAIITNINIISLTLVTISTTSSASMPLVIVFAVFTVVCLIFLGLFLKDIKRAT